ncbi:hypothetical protein PVAP13_5KG172007 [Panicum virgatum]|uniref:Uncharacterized protein n=1 Tax=Panicum virgatum TaxID=38727 RepID=A0A8T0SEJ4_PANVG|nr:hypothetical protein PVAP13_5KG172007 [Panicum virgatum]
MGGDHRTWIRNPVFGDKSSMMLQQHAFFGTSFVSRGNISRFIGHVVGLADFPANTCVSIRIRSNAMCDVV